MVDARQAVVVVEREGTGASKKRVQAGMQGAYLSAAPDRLSAELKMGYPLCLFFLALFSERKRIRHRSENRGGALKGEWSDGLGGKEDGEVCGVLDGHGLHRSGTRLRVADRRGGRSSASKGKPRC